jgi:cytosine/adenosine deaminase-related metal-dependent hydrolase
MFERARAAAGVSLDLRTGVAPHSLRAVDPAQMNELVAGVRSIDPAAPIHIHCAEQTKEVDDLRRLERDAPGPVAARAPARWMRAGASCTRLR